MTPEHEELLRITELTCDQLRQAAAAIPEEKLDWSPAEGALSPRRQIVHACGADRGYANRIDGGQRRTHFDLEKELGTKDRLLAHLDETRRVALDLIRSQGDLGRQVDIPWRPGATVRFVLLHMLRHKHYHTGQLNLMRWMLGVGV